jgi:large subunit ribosomal protein L7Ae
MPKETKQRRGKQVAAAPYDKNAKAPVKGGKKAVPAQPAKKANKGPSPALFEKRPKNFGIGQDIQPKRDLTRFVRWPKYIRMQRQKRVLLHRLKVPPTINQFTRTLDKNLGTHSLSQS